jgi:opacity protein-like surface antigen
MQKPKCVIALCVVLVLGGSQAEAQIARWEDRGYLGVNLGLQPQSRTFTEQATPLIYGENASITVPHTLDSSPFFDASAGVRVWEDFGIGIGYSRVGTTETATLSAQVPSPLAFDSPRLATGSTGELSHTESAVHVQLLWMMPVSGKLQAAAVLGPSFFTVKQALVTGFNLVEGARPFETVTISSAQTQEQSNTDIALTVGADVAYLVTPRVGAGAFLRYARLSGGNIDLATSDGTGEVGVPAGGFQLGFGLRVRF